MIDLIRNEIKAELAEKKILRKETGVTNRSRLPSYLAGYITALEGVLDDLKLYRFCLWCGNSFKSSSLNHSVCSEDCEINLYN